MEIDTGYMCIRLLLTCVCLWSILHVYIYLLHIKIAIAHSAILKFNKTTIFYYIYEVFFRVYLFEQTGFDRRGRNANIFMLEIV